MIEVAINGCNGKMGQVIADTIAASFADQARVSYGVDLVASQNGAFPVYASFTRIPTEAHADVMIDFSNPAALPGLLDYTVSRNIPVVIATTGLSRENSCILVCKYVDRYLPSERACEKGSGVSWRVL